MKIILIVLSSIFVYSCNSSNKKFSSEELDWFKIYKKGQKIIFKSNLGKLDTLIVSQISTEYNSLEKLFKEEQYNKSIVITSTNCKNASYCNVEISINKDEDDRQNFPSFNAFGLCNINNNQPYKESFKLITNVNCNSVYVFELGLNAYNLDNSLMKSFYWDKKEGLICYETNNEEVFELLKKIKGK